MLSKHERNRSSRRALYVGLAVSAAGHVAALVWLALPVRPIERAAPSLAMIAPVELPELINIVEPKVTPVSAATTQMSSGGAGEPGASSAPPASAPSTRAAEPVIASASQGRPDLATVDTAFAPVPAAAPVVVAVGRHPAEPEDQPVPQAGAATRMPTHTPGSAARAKGGGAGNTTGIGGAGADIGRGGIIIRTGPKRHPKRHPPRGIPGRRY